MKSTLVLFTSLLLSTLGLTLATTFCTTDNEWSLNWEDTFSTLDLTSWSVRNSSEVGSCRDAWCTPNNVYIENGNLVLVSKNESMYGYNYTTGSVYTQNKKYWNAYDSTYRLCVTAKLPGGNSQKPHAGAGIWPAAWMMPNDNSCWPDHGEIDILEMINGDSFAHGTYHWESTYPAQNCSYPKGHQSITSELSINNWDTDYHEYAVEHSSTYLAYIYDGQVVFNVSSDPTNSSAPQYIDTPFYLILNTAVGGPWPGPANASTVFPTYYYIDSVKVVTKNV